MAVDPQYRNQYTSLDARRAKNRIKKECKSCGAGLSSNLRTYCGPCASERADEYQRIKSGYYDRFDRLRKDPDEVTEKKPRRRSYEAPEKNNTKPCARCSTPITLAGRKTLCHICAHEVVSERNRIRARRSQGYGYRLTDLEISKAMELWNSGLRTDEIAKEMKLPEACIANSLWAERYGEVAA